VEIKTEWVPIQPDQYSRYIVATTTKGTRGLVAFHVKVHDIVSWKWATFIHVDRSAGVALNDNFGLAKERPSTRLLSLLAGNKAEILANYRLIGAQVDSMPPLLGNPLIEGDTAGTSSCQGCHETALISDLDARIAPRGDSGAPFKLVYFDWTMAKSAICMCPSARCLNGTPLTPPVCP